MESGYLSRAMHLFPQQGSHGSWAADQNYALDRSQLSAVDDPALTFTESVVHTAATPAETAAV
jgi:monooxygenase